MRRATSPQGLLALVAAGVGITRLAASARTLRTGGVRFVELQDERAGIVLIALSPTTATRIGSALFTGSALVLFTVSAIYHTGTWSPRTTNRSF